MLDSIAAVRLAKAHDPVFGNHLDDAAGGSGLAPKLRRRGASNGTFTDVTLISTTLSFKRSSPTLLHSVTGIMQATKAERGFGLPSDPRVFPR